MIPHNTNEPLVFFVIIIVSCFVLYWLFFSYKPKMDKQVIAWHINADFEDLIFKIRLTTSASELNELYETDVKSFVDAFNTITGFARYKSELYAEVYNRRIQFSYNEG